MILMGLILTGAVVQTRMPCSVAVRVSDDITQIHVASVMKVHRLPCERSPVMGFGNMAFNVDAPSELVAQVLAKDAPPRDFSIGIYGFREFSDSDWHSWKLVASPWRARSSVASYGLDAFWRAEGLAKADVALVRFRARGYLGDDGHRHTGVDLAVGVRSAIRQFQLLEVAGKRMAIDSGTGVVKRLPACRGAAPASASPRHPWAHGAATVTAGSATTSYIFDNNGNQILVNAAGVFTSMSYDNENRLATHLAPGSTVSYTYSGDMLKRAEWVAGSPTTLVWDGQSYLGGVS